jgi:hypothetical protein
MLAMVLSVAALVAGCGTGASPGQPAGAASPGLEGTLAGSAGSGGSAGSAGGDCPLTEAELSSATSLAWKHRETRKDHQLETVDSVKVTACIFTAAEAAQVGGDPLVLRVDVVGPKDADVVRKNFADNCTEFGGTQRAGGGGTMCDRSGTVVDGTIGNLVVVEIVNADTETAAKLTPSFEKVLAGAG